MRNRNTLVRMLAVLLCLTALVISASARADESAEESGAVKEVTGGVESDALTPEGNMTLVDNITGDAAGAKQFIVVQSRGGNYFYIVIDGSDQGENTVHFLNQVDEEDLLSLIDAGEIAPVVCTCTTKCKAGEVNTDCEICAVNMTECAGIEPVPEEPEESENPGEEPETEQDAKGSASGILIVVFVIVLVGGVAAYFKFFKKKSSVKGNDDLDDYDYGDEDDDEDEDDEDYDDENEEDEEDDDSETEDE